MDSRALTPRAMIMHNAWRVGLSPNATAGEHDADADVEASGSGTGRSRLMGELKELLTRTMARYEERWEQTAKKAPLRGAYNGKWEGRV